VKRLIVLLTLLLGLAFATRYPLTVTDELGREVTLASEPERVVSMLPSHTETLCALDACAKLVGLDSFSDYPSEIQDLPRLGSGLSGVDDAPDVEAIVTLQPDLVLVSEFGELASQLELAGLTVYAGSPQTLEDAYTFFAVLGELVGREAEAAVLTGRVQGEIAAIERLVGGLEPTSVYYELDPTPYSVGPNSFIGVLIEKAGGANIVDAALGDFPQLDPEYLVAADPEVIILADAPFGESAATVAARPGWGGLRALETGRVYELSEAESDLTGRAGPRVAEVVRLFARLLHPEVFD
jgi:iron complex transport system substrate-binding protein